MEHPENSSEYAGLQVNSGVEQPSIVNPYLKRNRFRRRELSAAEMVEGIVKGDVTILSQAVTELKNDEFSELYEAEIKEGEKISGADFVDDCTIESDLEMYLPDQYVPSSSERMLLYRELENIKNDADLEKYKKRLQDRFGEIPSEGLELMQVVPLRRLGRQLGCEKITLKQEQMMMFFVSNPMSAFYKSDAFGDVLQYVAQNPRTCSLREIKGKRSLVVKNVTSVEMAVSVLRKIGKSLN